MNFLSSSNPGLRARVIPQFPARVTAVSPITVTKSGLTYTFSFSGASLPLNANAAISFGSGDVTITHSTNALSFTGASLGYSFDALLNLTGGQIKFPAADVPSTDPNTLDDYEEGTWTPTLTFSTPGNLSVSYTTRVGSYTKKGREVTISFQVITSAFTHTTASGVLLFTGLPFANNSTVIGFGAVQWQGITKAGYTHIVAFVFVGESQIRFNISGSGQVIANISTGDVPTGGSINIAGTLTYHV